MADGRMLKKAISHSRRLAKLKTDTARLLYTWILPHLDIEGRFSANPDIIKGVIVPRIRSIGTKKIENCLYDMAEQELITLYEHDNDKYLQYRKFKDHQILRTDRESESKIPTPTPTQLQANSSPTPAQVKLKQVKSKQNKDDGKELNEFLDYFNLKTKKRLSLTPERKRIIEQRLKTYTIEQLKKAVDNFSEDTWAERHRFTDVVYCIGVRNKIDNLDKWLNVKPKEKDWTQT